MHFGVHAGEYNGYLFLLRHLAKAFQIVDTRRVNKRNFTHADDAHFGAVAKLRHYFLKLCGDAEEIGTVDFVHFHAFRNNEMFLICGNVRFGIRVYFVFDNRYLGGFHDVKHKEYAGDDQAYFNGDCQIEDYRQEESYQ